MNEDTKIILDYLISKSLSYQHKYREIIVLDCYDSKTLKDLAELGFFYDGDNLKYDIPKNMMEKIIEQRK
jgi:hypothetical protein